MAPTRFVQIAAGPTWLYALDSDGVVWKYYPQEGQRFAFWGKLTTHRAKP